MYLKMDLIEWGAMLWTGFMWLRTVVRWDLVNTIINISLEKRQGI
jgi:hypothetical protein